MADLIGKNIGQYQIVEQIGIGGMATIYKAYQASIDRYVAIKILPEQFAKDANFLKRFQQEARAIAALEHPHILPVHDFGTEDGRSYMVMRYIEGGTLTKQMGHPLPYKRIIQIVGDIARALDYAHERGVVHRDIKPSNILIDKHGEVLLTDFGIAKMVEGTEATQLTGAGTILGTPAYMSPEQATGGNIDGRSDIYSLGVVLYELLTGQPPYQAETPLAVVMKHVNAPLPPPRALKTEIPEALERIVLKAMAKDPNQRFQTAAEMEQALREAYQTVDTPSAQIFEPEPAPSDPKPKSRVGFFLVVGAIVALLLCLGGGTILFLVAVTTPPKEATQVTGGDIQVTISANDSTATPISILETVATPTPTPEEEINPAGPTETGEIIFAEDFDTDENGWYTGVYEEEDYYLAEVILEEGYYRLSLTADDSIYYEEILPDEEFSDFVLTVEATPQDTAEHYSYGVVFREDWDGDCYTLEIGNDGLYAIFLYDGEWIMLKEWSSSSAIKVGQTNQIKIIANDEAMSFFVNDELLTTLEDDTLSEGTVGVLVELFEDEGLQTGTVHFDNLVLHEIEE